MAKVRNRKKATRPRQPEKALVGKEHAPTARQEHKTKGTRIREKNARMWRGHCKCGWKADEQRARRSPALREAEKHVERVHPGAR